MNPPSLGQKSDPSSGATIPRWLVAGLAILAVIASLATIVVPRAYRALPLLSPDSATYLEWSPGRTPAYPVFLSAVRTFSRDLSALGGVQLTLFLGSAIFCALAFNHMYGRPLAALLLGAGVMLHPQLVSYAFAALPELLFSAALLAHFGTILIAAQTNRPAWYMAAGVTLALLILLKPSGYALLACLPAVALCAASHRWRALLSAVVPLAVALAGVATMNLLHHGFFATQAQGGYSLIAHAGSFVTPVHAGDLTAVTNAIADDVKPHREALDRIDALDLYYVFASHDYHAIEAIVRRRIVEDIERRHRIVVTDHRPFPSDPLILREITTAGGAIALRAILDHPREYARHVLADLYGLWLLPLIQPAGAVTRLSAELAAIRAISPSLDHSPVAFRSVPLPVFLAIRALLIAVFAASLALAALMAARRTPFYLPLGYTAIALHANYLLVAAVQPGLPRYALVMWPASVLVLIGAGSLMMARATSYASATS